ncbi:hypothetical protein TIFTF001_019162 [Ficus carica]|uniref:Uncharacterized protein n=1 Tax=Ficus carica TaxID=3494 RepID=A0AA88ASP1_FICCA|nr:hypothetical protein TIFTF001_019162 [Ficus carica]
MQARDLDGLGEAEAQEGAADVLDRGEEDLPGLLVVVAEDLVPNGDSDDLGRRVEWLHVGFDPVHGSVLVDAYVFQELVAEVDDDLNPRASEGGKDLVVGVVDSDVLDLRCLEECHHALQGREVVGNSAVVYTVHPGHTTISKFRLDEISRKEGYSGELCLSDIQMDDRVLNNLPSSRLSLETLQTLEVEAINLHSFDFKQGGGFHSKKCDLSLILNQHLKNIFFTLRGQWDSLEATVDAPNLAYFSTSSMAPRMLVSFVALKSSRRSEKDAQFSVAGSQAYEGKDRQSTMLEDDAPKMLTLDCTF